MQEPCKLRTARSRTRGNMNVSPWTVPGPVTLLLPISTCEVKSNVSLNRGVNQSLKSFRYLKKPRKPLKCLVEPRYDLSPAVWECAECVLLTASFLSSNLGCLWQNGTNYISLLIVKFLLMNWAISSLAQLTFSRRRLPISQDEQKRFQYL